MMSNQMMLTNKTTMKMYMAMTAMPNKNTMMQTNTTIMQMNKNKVKGVQMSDNKMRLIMNSNNKMAMLMDHDTPTQANNNKIMPSN